MADGPLPETFGMLREFSAHVPLFERGKSADVFFQGIPETSALKAPIQNVFSEDGFSSFVHVAFETPLSQSFRVQKPGIVAEFRRFFVKRPEPEARSFRSRHQARFGNPVFVSRRGAGDEASDFREFELSEGFRVTFEFDPERSGVERVEEYGFPKSPFGSSTDSVSFVAPVPKFGTGKESFRRLSNPVGLRHRYAEF